MTLFLEEAVMRKKEALKCECCGKTIAWKSGDDIVERNDNFAGCRHIIGDEWAWMCKKCDATFFARGRAMRDERR